MLQLQPSDIPLARWVERRGNTGIYLLGVPKQPRLDIQFWQVLLVGLRVEDLKSEQHVAAAGKDADRGIGARVVVRHMRRRLLRRRTRGLFVLSVHHDSGKG